MFDDSVLFIKGAQGFVPQAIIKNLKDAGINVVETGTDSAEIEEKKDEADVILYYLGNIKSVTDRVMGTLSGISGEGLKTLCVIGDESGLNDAKTSPGKDIITAAYKRPVEVKLLTDDISAYINKHKELSRTKKILIVDDDNDYLMMISHLLKESYDTVLAKSASEAMEYLSESGVPDLILLDYIMPGTDGYEFLKNLRENHRFAYLPVIFLTGNDDKASVMKVIDEKPDGYILKTTPKTEMLHTLSDFFKSYILESHP